jgi:uncharacterized iron-regulated protein
MTAHHALGPLVEKNDAGKELTVLAVVRAAARECTHANYRLAMTIAADDLDAAINRLFHNPTTTNMQNATALWAHLVRVYEGRPQEAPDNPPLAGAPEAARLAA